MIEEYEKKQKEKKDLENAGANTAHAAGKAAATYFGGGAAGNIAYDKLANTKLGKGIEKGVGKVIGKTPVVNKLNKKLNDAGVPDAVNKASDIASGRNLIKKKEAKNNDTSIPNALKNKHHFQSIKNRFQKSGVNEENDNLDNNLDNNEELEANDDSLLSENTKAVLLKKMLPYILMALGGILALFLIFVILSSLISSVSSFFSLSGHEGGEGGYVYTDPEMLAAEKAYNDAINNTITSYQQKYSVNLDKYLLNSIISYRYLSDTDDLYTDINEELEVDSEEGIDYNDATKKIKTVAKIMIYNDNGVYRTDNEVDGVVYNQLIDSNFLTSYYKDFLKDTSYESRKKLVDDIYIYYEFAKEMTTETSLNSVVSDTMIVYLQTCGKKTKLINGIEVFDNPLTNEGTEYPTYLSLKDYIKGVLQAEVGSYLKTEYKEFLKAHAIMALTYLINDDNSGYDTHTGSLYFPNGSCRQNACDPVYGCAHDSNSQTFSGYGRTLAPNGDIISDPYWKEPLTDAEHSLIDSILTEVFGYIMVNKGVTDQTFAGSKDVSYIEYRSELALCGASNILGICLGQREARQDALNGMDYKSILAKYYYNVNYDLINIREGLYISPGEVDYINAQFDGDVIFYEQTDYKQKGFCGRPDATISGSGCGVTAAAIITSTFEKSTTFNPVYMMNFAWQSGDCGAGISGTAPSFFKRVAQRFGYGYQNVGKFNSVAVINALKNGNSMVVAHMGAGHFTDNGHYIVLSGVNTAGQVYVHDPYNRNNKSNRKTGNGWYNINMIANELRGEFHILTKG